MDREALDQRPVDELRLYLAAQALRNRAKLIVVVVVVLTAAVGAYAFTRSPSYEAEAKVMLRPITGNAFSEESALNAQQVTIAMETEAGLVSSPAVTQLVSQELGYQVAPGSDDVRASIPPNTQIVQIAYRADSPAKARDGADGFARSFLKYRANQATATRSRQLDTLRKQERTAARSLEVASSQASGANPPPEASAQVQLYTSRLATIQEGIGTLRAKETDAGTIVTPAALPSGPAGLSPLLLTALAAIFATMLAFALALWRERNDDRVLAEDVTVGDLPVIGAVPVEGSGTLELLASDDERANAYRRVRTGIVASLEHPSLVVFAAAEDSIAPDVTARVSTKVAIALRASGYRVTLVDATMGRGDVAALCGLRPAAGLSEALARGAAAPRLTEKFGLSILPAGLNPAAATELFGGDALPHLMSTLREGTDFVVVAAAAADSVEASAVALTSDAVVLLMDDTVSTHRSVTRVVQGMKALGAPVLAGVCLVRGVRGAKRTPHVDTAPPVVGAPSTTPSETDGVVVHDIQSVAQGSSSQRRT